MTLKELREQRHWSQERTAARCGVCFQTYSRIERGVGKPSYDTYQRICDVFGAEPDDIYPVSKGRRNKAPQIAVPPGRHTLLQLRLRRGLTQAQVAKIIGVSPTTYSLWENRKAAATMANESGKRHFEALVEFFGETPYDLITTRGTNSRLRCSDAEIDQLANGLY